MISNEHFLTVFIIVSLCVCHLGGGGVGGGGGQNCTRGGPRVFEKLLEAVGPS